MFDDRGDLLLRKSPVDVLRAVDGPGLNREHDRAFDLSGIGRIAELLFQCRIAFDHPRRAPHFHPPTVGVVHQEEECLRVLGEISERDVLTVAAEVSESEGVLVEHLEEKVRERTAQLEVRTQLIEQTFGRYMSTEIAESLLKTPRGLSLSGEKKIVTIMMSDLRGFSALCETLPPETIVKVLNNYLSEMTTVIQKHNGTIHEFIGDAILAIFGAPLQRPDDAYRAVACALEMQIAMDRVNAWNDQHGFPRLEMGIGINTGEAVAGTIGSDKRAKYSVVGSNVNLAVRIEGYTIGGQILISQATRDAVKATLGIVRSLTAEPKGIANPITIYEVESMEDDRALALPPVAGG